MNRQKKLIFDNEWTSNCEVYLDSHSNMDKYAQEGSVDAIVFNFGWLPGGNHKVFTKPETSIQAIEKGLRLIKKRGIIALCIYSGKDTGFEEKHAILEYLKSIDDKKYTIIVSEFFNRTNNPPIPVFIIKE